MGNSFDQLGDKFGDLNVGGHFDDAWKNTGNSFDNMGTDMNDLLNDMKINFGNLNGGNSWP
jgi:hypothetical protein